MDITYLRSFRIFNLALFDYIASILIFYLVFEMFNIEHSLRNYLLIGPVAIISHLAISQDSTINRNLFNDNLNGYKIFVMLNILLIIVLS